MDSRVIKTKKALQEAYLRLRKSCGGEKIKIKDICQLANVNKTTFYHHYEDLNALIEDTENEAISQFLETFEAKNQLFSDPYRFISDLPIALDSQKEILRPLFYEKPEKLVMLLEYHLKRMYSEYLQTEQGTVLLTFMLGGTFHTLYAMKKDHNSDDEQLARYMARILEGLISCLNQTDVQ